jgi:hypothetical protein
VGLAVEAMVTLRPAYRASCDRPRCKHAEYVPHAKTGPARAQLVSRGWTILAWRFEHPGIVRRGFKPTRREHQDDVGGGPRHVFLCPRCGHWRPRGGVIEVIGHKPGAANETMRAALMGYR